MLKVRFDFAIFMFPIANEKFKEPWISFLTH